MDDGQKFYLGVNGEQQGPFSEEAVRQKVLAGEISGDTLVWYEGLSEWQALSTISYFKPQAHAPESPAAPGDTPPEPPDESVREKSVSVTAGSAAAAGKFKPLAQVLGSAPVPGGAAAPIPEDSSSDDSEPNEPSISQVAANPPSRAARPLPERSAAPEKHEPAWKKKGDKPPAPEKGEVILTFALAGKKPRAVFSRKEAVFGAASPMKNYAIAGAAVLGLGVLGIYVLGDGSGDKGPQVASAPKVEPRDVRLALAKDNIILNPGSGVTELKRLLAENGKDDVGKAAYQALELHYWEKQNYLALGQMMLDSGEPAKAVDVFLKDPRLVGEVEKAYAELFKQSQDPEQKKKALLAQVELLLGPLKRKSEAIVQIQLFEKTFPGQPHPYQFYTLPGSKQIAELFERTSFYFLANLNGFIEGEFPQMKLAHSPKVEVRTEGDRYRIAGSYQGEVHLYRDRLKGVYLHFWLVDGQWAVVETNLTKDRKKYAQEKREQLASRTTDENSMLKYLESIFEQEFPRTPLHVRAPRATAASAPQNLDDK